MDIKVQSCVSEGVYADLCEIASANECFSKLKNTTVMVTGADGFVGRLLTAALLLRNDLFGDGIRAAAKVRSREDAEKKFGRLCGRDDLTIISDGFVRADLAAVLQDPVIRSMSRAQIEKMISDDRDRMKKSASDLDFTSAARYRDEMWALQEYLKVWKD